MSAHSSVPTCMHFQCLASWDAPFFCCFASAQPSLFSCVVACGVDRLARSTPVLGVFRLAFAGRCSLCAGWSPALLFACSGALSGLPLWRSLPLVFVACLVLWPCMKRRVRVRLLACLGAASAFCLFVLSSGCRPPPTPVEQELHAAYWQVQSRCVRAPAWVASGCTWSICLLGSDRHRSSSALTQVCCQRCQKKKMP